MPRPKREHVAESDGGQTYKRRKVKSNSQVHRAQRSATNVSYGWSLNWDCIFLVLNHLSLPDLAAFAATSSACYTAARWAVLQRINVFLRAYIGQQSISVDLFRDVMRQQNVYMTGSAALYLALGSAAAFYPSDADFAVPAGPEGDKFCDFIKRLGYKKIRVTASRRAIHSASRGPSFQTFVAKISTYIRPSDNRRMEILHSRTPWALDVVLSSPLTVLRNFVSADFIGVMYPWYTFKSETLLLQRRAPTKAVIFQMRKYRERGFATHDSNWYLGHKRSFLRYTHSRSKQSPKPLRTVFVFGMLFPFGPGRNSILDTLYISSVPNLILAFIPAQNAQHYDCTGGLLSDVLLHLVPHRFTGGSQAPGARFILVNEKCNMLIGLVTFGGSAAFFVMEKTLRVLGAEGHDHSHSEGDEHATMTAMEASDASDLRQRKGVNDEHDHAHEREREKAKGGPSKLSAYLNLSSATSSPMTASGPHLSRRNAQT
ncbi:hypothetical protein EXIGLDRAFT_780885 [Exidia glandulosa HHB12029]|uniref:F-box domain-containing protein n=1 Tax=Exidia glandulosa HHB12029 TaxID=1314781 RepID=A0A165BF09_EXIGL|nr:hypothetical protein EXIGLDRAFT_780885 [Exidia glandulosa HHB12029]